MKGIATTPRGPDRPYWRPGYGIATLRPDCPQCGHQSSGPPLQTAPGIATRAFMPSPEDLQQQSDCLVGRLIRNVIWYGGARPIGSDPTPSLLWFDPSTGSRLGKTLIPFDVKNISIERRGTLFLFGDNEGVVVTRNGRLLRRFGHSFGFAKGSAPCRVDNQVLVTSQDQDRIRRVDMTLLQGVGDGIVIINDSTSNVWHRRDPTGSHGLTSRDPRGVAQSPRLPYRIWVACKGGNRRDVDPPAMVQCFDFETGRLVWERRIPFGARGICIDPSQTNSGVDEIWVACLGEQLSMMDPETAAGGDGNTVVRIRDSRTRQVAFIVLGGGPRGPISITSSIRGDKYVACASSNEIWKIPRDVDGLLQPLSDSPIPRDPTFLLPEDAVPGWPVRIEPLFGVQQAPGPISVSIDGNGMIWVQCKNSAQLVRIDESGSVTSISGNHVPDAKPENLGDFTGYYTAAGLFPCCRFPRFLTGPAAGLADLIDLRGPPGMALSAEVGSIASRLRG